MPGPDVHDLKGVRWVIFNRPEKLNALTPDDIRTATAALESAHSQVNAVVFAGTGERAFSAGVNVDVFRNMSPTGAREFITELGGLTSAARQASVPTLCSITGYCLGGAMELAMACDLRVGSTTAVFGMPEIRVGIPSVLDAALLQQYLGLSKAKEMLLTGDLYPAAELQRFGFLNVMVPPAELRRATEDLAWRVAAQPRPAVAAQKRLFNTWQDVGLRASMDASIGEFAEVFGHPDTLDRVMDYRRKGSE